ncbi:MAG: gliding motility-associated C-terminal domain-containing protein [Bacteroidetes bacterium]|nr:gliding motility-associated C-terminal domain-containing protein [Bacteroidota bacterium]
MKKIFFSAVFLFALNFSNAQLYNSTNMFYTDAGAIVFVDGDVYNDTAGHIKNNGDIYFTQDWTNHEPAFGLDATAGTVHMAGANQLIKGSQTTTFNNLDCQNTGTKTLNINTIVGGTSGVLSLNNAPFNLNSKTLIVTNPLPAAVTRNSGYIISETDPAAGYGIVEWRMGNTTAGNNYVYPFGTSGGTYLPFLWNIKTAGVETSNGNMSVATYPTNVTASPNNMPFPTGVTNLADGSGKNAASYCLDRYWILNSNNYSTNAVADITLTYRDAEWDNSVSGTTNNFASEDDLKGWKWSGSAWQNPPVGIVNTNANTVSVTGISGSAPWTLTGNELICGDFFIPNAFSPNGDGHNEIFNVRNKCIKDIDLKIFNRWGNLVFETTDPAQGWDGSTPKGKDGNEGVYAYQAKGHMNDGTEIDKKGTVTLMK